MVANVGGIDVVPLMGLELDFRAVLDSVDDSEVVGRDVCSAVEADVAVRAEAQQVLGEVGSAVLSGPDMSRFAVAVVG